jgi:hypothetical protein
MKRIAIAVALVAALAACAETGSLQESATCSATGKFVGSEVVRDLYTKRVAIGMTPCEVVAAWGEPVDVDIMNSWTTVYRFRDGRRYAAAWFRNERLDSIHHGWIDQ